MEPERELADVEKNYILSKSANTSGVDAGLIAMFLQMTPEERLMSNDNAINAIEELRNAGRGKPTPPLSKIENSGFRFASPTRPD